MSGSDEPFKPTLVDRIYERLPERVQNWIYDHSPQMVQDRLDQRAWDKEVAAPAAQDDLAYERQKKELDEFASRLNDAIGQTSEQILTRGFLEHEVDRLGKFAERIISEINAGHVIATGAELNHRIRESGQSLEHSKENGWYLSHTHERVSDQAVSERRAGWERMRAELGADNARTPDLNQQQQQTRDWVSDMVKRLEQVEREQPKERRQERGEERER